MEKHDLIKSLSQTIRKELKSLGNQSVLFTKTTVLAKVIECCLTLFSHVLLRPQSWKGKPGFSVCHKTHNSSLLTQTHRDSSVMIYCIVERQDEESTFKTQVHFLPDENMFSLT